LRRMVLSGESSVHRLNWPGRITSMCVEDIAHVIVEVSRRKPTGDQPALYIAVGENLTVADIARAYHQAYELEYDPIHIPGLFWKMIEVATAPKRVWEKILPHALYNKIWQINILVTQAYWNESGKMRDILGAYRLTTFKEFCSKLVQQERDSKLHEILRRDSGVHPT
jgi:hypothetical protein